MSAKPQRRDEHEAVQPDLSADPQPSIRLSPSMVGRWIHDVERESGVRSTAEGNDAVDGIAPSQAPQDDRTVARAARMPPSVLAGWLRASEDAAPPPAGADGGPHSEHTLLMPSTPHRAWPPAPVSFQMAPPAPFVPRPRAGPVPPWMIAALIVTTALSIGLFTALLLLR